MKCKKCGSEISPFVVFMNKSPESISIYVEWIEKGKPNQLCIDCFTNELIEKQEPVKYRV